MATIPIQVSQTLVTMLVVLLVAFTLLPNCQLLAAKDGNERLMVKPSILGVDTEGHPGGEIAGGHGAKTYMQPKRGLLEDNAQYELDRWPGDNGGRGDDRGGRGDDRGGRGDDRGGRGDGGWDRRCDRWRDRDCRCDRWRDRDCPPDFAFSSTGAAVTVSGSIFCSSCSKVEKTPLFGESYFSSSLHAMRD